MPSSAAVLVVNSPLHAADKPLPYYTAIVQRTTEILSELPMRFPEFAGRQYETSGYYVIGDAMGYAILKLQEISPNVVR